MTRRDELSTRHQHLFRSHAQAGGACPSFHAVFGQVVDAVDRVGELCAGAHLLDDPARVLAAIADLRRDVAVLAYDERCAEEFGRLRGVLRRLDVTANPVDLMIAAVALVHGLTLVTHNVRDFSSVPGLHVVDWLAP